MKPARTNPDASINLTPMIDVVFLLVIFFLVGSKFEGQEERVNVNVPGSAQARAMTRGPDERIVEVALDGAITLDGVAMDPESLYQTLQQQRASYPDLRVAVRGEAQSPLARVADVMQIVSRSGVETMGFAVKGVRR
ncbi:MAG: biopolymer transporter ExbD [Planctomycetota bacterium]